MYMYDQFLHSLRMRKGFEIACPMLYCLSYYINTNVILYQLPERDINCGFKTTGQEKLQMKDLKTS